MNHAFNLFLLENRVHVLLVADVDLVEPRLRAHGGAEARQQVIDDDDIPPGVNQRGNRVGADIPGAAQYKNRHRNSPSLNSLRKTLPPVPLPFQARGNDNKRLSPGRHSATRQPPCGRMRVTWQHPAPQSFSMPVRNASSFSTGTNA